MNDSNGYRYLEARNGTRFKQLFVKGRKFSAERVYRETVGEDPRTPEEVAADLDLPLEAVHEAIDYATRNEELLRKEREERHARINEVLKKYPPLLPPDCQAQT